VARTTKALPERMTVFHAWERARRGPKVDEKTWDFEIIPKTATRLKEKHGIQMDKKVMIPTDPDLMNRLYEAGLEMLVECGIYMIETGRVVKYTQDEVLFTVAQAPKHATIGEGALHYRPLAPRAWNSTTPPIIQGGPTGAPCSEQHFLGIHESYAKEGIVDCIVDGVLEKINGYNPAPESPAEVWASKQEMLLVRQAQAKACRSGMGL
jgi:methylamine---corrinoid protein Co-methyltransferase